MNKQQAIEKIKNTDTLNINDNIAGQKIDMVIKNQVLDIVSQIDEPQKAVVPAFIDSFIGYAKAEGMSLFIAMDNAQNKESEWIITNEDNFARAWLDGYEIEQEKLYTVEVPNPNDKYCMNVLKRQPSGEIKLVSLHRSNKSFLKNKEYQLTEAEIKQDFEWAWKWAEPVEE